MGRKKSSPADDLIKIVSLLPWWAGIMAAVFSFVLLHAWSKPPASNIANVAQMAEFARRSMVATLAGIGQYIIPPLCLVGAFVSFRRYRTREQLVVRAASARAADAAHGMSWREFESLVAQAFRLQGYQVEETGGSAPDGGVDIELRKGRELFLVQCKHWKAYQVSVQVVREFYGVMARRGAAGGFIVTSGRFTEDAVQFVEGTNLRLIDGSRLFGLLQQAKVQGRIQPIAAATPQSAPAPAATRSESASPPACPTCAAAMTRRTAKKGTHAGADFWGCVRFPDCRGTRAI